MDLGYGARYEAFRRQVRAFLQTHASEAPERGGLGAVDQRHIAWQKRLIEHGYAARTVPGEYGGYGAASDPLEQVIIAEEFNRAGISRGLSGQGPDMLVPTLLQHGDEAQKQRWIPPTIRGELVWCQGYSEPEAGSDLANVQTRAIADGDHLVVNGQKIWTTGAQLADMMFALVRTEPGAAKHAGLSYLLVPMDAPGIEVRPLVTMTGGAEFNEVFFSDVRVPQENVVGGRGQGWKVANTTLRHERNMLASSAQLEASMQRLLSLMEREHIDGVRALDHPIFRDRAMRLQAEVLAMKYHGMRMLSASLKNESPGPAALVTKLVGCELSHQIARLAIDVMGELGVLSSAAQQEPQAAGWQFQYMFSLGLIIGGGTAQIQRNIIAERGLGLPREPRTPGRNE